MQSKYSIRNIITTQSLPETHSRNQNRWQTQSPLPLDKTKVTTQMKSLHMSSARRSTNEKANLLVDSGGARSCSGGAPSAIPKPSLGLLLLSDGGALTPVNRRSIPASGSEMKFGVLSEVIEKSTFDHPLPLALCSSTCTPRQH